MKDSVPDLFQEHIDAICTGLASLPPFIPLQILSKAAKVDVEQVRSFVADLGRPLWVTDNSIQFRDEPTETWFRNKFSATPDQIGNYIDKLKPIAIDFPYVAEILPSLLLRAEKYNELIDLALSDDLLPEDSLIDARNIRVSRLQFAFKAALKQKKYSDAAKLAFRAGEEVAGDERQLELLLENTDLIQPLQSDQRLQELSHRRLIRGQWEGSENIYSASLLSNVDDCKGEARGYLRAGERWLKIYFEERDNKNRNHSDKLTDQDILEMTNTHFNLFGESNAVKFMLSWKPPSTIFKVASLFTARLIDKADFPSINRMLKFGIDSPSFVIAVSNELMSVGRCPSKKVLTRSLNLIVKKKTRLNKPKSGFEPDSIESAMLSFLEACVIKKVPSRNIKWALNYYIKEPTIYSVNSDINSPQRTIFMRSSAIKAAISGDFNLDATLLFPKSWSKGEKKYDEEQEIKKCKKVIRALLPWFMVRARIISGEKLSLSKTHEKAQEISNSILSHRYREYDPIPFEISSARFFNYILMEEPDEKEAIQLVNEDHDKKLSFRLDDRIDALRACYRSDHLKSIRDKLEKSCYETATNVDGEGPEENARWFIQIARAVLPVNHNDASAYFNRAIEAVSKFGEEVVQRWNAIVSVAKRSAESELGTPELAYRFMRCAELIGETVGREKYWDREEAVKTSFLLSPASAFAIASRWQDRNIGWPERQLPALAEQAVKFNEISPSAGWSLSAFSWDSYFKDFAFLCIDKENDKARQQYILDSFVRDLQIKRGISEDIWKAICKLSKKHGLHLTGLSYLKELFEDNKNKKNDNIALRHDYNKDNDKHDWGDLLSGIDLTENEGISKAILVFKNLDGPRDYEHFWESIFNLINVKNAAKILVSIVDAEHANIYDIESAFSNFPLTWKTKPSVEREWEKSISSVAQRFASEFTNTYRQNSFLEIMGRSDDAVVTLIDGVIKGLSDSCNLISANTFYGFSKMSVSLISPEEANDLLNYSLSRFENHIDSDYADGEWSDCLIPPSDITMAFTGYIWANLGSPVSSERWRAVHVVKRLYGLRCSNEVDALLEWMRHGMVDSFGYKDYPFYTFHAKQYLLIALSRAVLDNPVLLKDHSKIFSTLVIDDEPHILIQKHSSDIALVIETAFPGTYEKQVVEKMKNICNSPFPTKYADKYKEKIDTPWHADDEIEKTQDLSFGYDFDRYWFEPLGDVFGVSGKQTEDLARQVVLNDWNIQFDKQFISDPRQHIWNSNQHDRATWHSHSEYPRTDNYSFYLSYHSMLSVASKLLSKMPVIHSHDWEEDEWGDWLNGHFLSRRDGYWLADRRDPPPIKRREWISEERSNDWQWEIKKADFFEGLFFDQNGETFICVSGSWSDNDGTGRQESYYISSAMSSTENNLSLLTALSTCSDPGNFKLPDYKEDQFEINEPGFCLTGWIVSPDNNKHLDASDPHAGDIHYPPRDISPEIIEFLQLTNDREKREYKNSEGNLVAVNQLWSESIVNDIYREELVRQGNRIYFSFKSLLALCKSKTCSLVFKVQIERRFAYSHYNRKESNEFRYPPAYCSVYCLTADGKFRDAATSYQLR